MGSSGMAEYMGTRTFRFTQTRIQQKLKMPKGGGLTKPMKLSADLAAIVGKDEASRAECIKLLWAYLKKNNLQDPENKQYFTPDKKMAKVFGSDHSRFRNGQIPLCSSLINGFPKKSSLFLRIGPRMTRKHRTEKFQSYISRNSISSILKKHLNLISKIISLSA